MFVTFRQPDEVGVGPRFYHGNLLSYPTYLSADLSFTAILLLFSATYSPGSPLNGTTKTDYMLGSECDLKTYVRKLGYPLLLQIGGKNHLFRRLRNLTANMMA